MNKKSSKESAKSVILTAEEAKGIGITKNGAFGCALYGTVGKTKRNLRAAAAALAAMWAAATTADVDYIAGEYETDELVAAIESAAWESLEPIGVTECGDLIQTCDIQQMNDLALLAADELGIEGELYNSFLGLVARRAAQYIG